jgi:hypothetical protein
MTFPNPVLTFLPSTLTMCFAKKSTVGNLQSHCGAVSILVFDKVANFIVNSDGQAGLNVVLCAGITEALMRRFINKGSFMTSRINWAIQSSGVDYRHESKRWQPAKPLRRGIYPRL